MLEPIPSTKQALSESFGLSQEILKDIELSQIPLSNIALKACRLARLLNEFELQKILEHEVSGYPTTPNGVYLAEDTKLDRKIAIKFPNPEFSGDWDKLNLFVQEAKAASSLYNPNVLTAVLSPLATALKKILKIRNPKSY